MSADWMAKALGLPVRDKHDQWTYPSYAAERVGPPNPTCHCDWDRPDTSQHSTDCPERPVGRFHPALAAPYVSVSVGGQLDGYAAYAKSIGCVTIHDEVIVETDEQARLLEKFWRETELRSLRPNVGKPTAPYGRYIPSGDDIMPIAKEITAQYAKRDAAFIEWLQGLGGENWPAGERAAARTAFNAGWQARKSAQYREIVHAK